MTMTLAVKRLPRRPEDYQHYRGPLAIAGRLWLDADGARLYERGSTTWPKA